MVARDGAEQALALVTAFGAVDQINAIGVVASGGITIPDPTVQGVNTATLGQATTAFALPAPAAGKKLRLILSQDATGSRLATFTTPSGAVQWPGSAAPTLTTTANKKDLITFECLDGVNWIGLANLNVG